MSRWFPLVVLAGCRTLAPTSASVLAELQATPGGHLAGTPNALANPRVLNREDFVYDARFSADAKRVATSRLGMKRYFLSVFTPAKSLEKDLDIDVNGYEFDVESIAFSPDSSQIVTGSRDGAVRVYDAARGTLTASWLSDEPVSSVAISPDSKWLGVGTARGLLTVLAWPSLTFVAEERAHRDEVRALEFDPQGRVLSGSWDRTIAVHTLVTSETPGPARVHSETTAGLEVFRVVADGKVSAPAVFDARVPVVVLKRALAESLGINTAVLTETLNVPAAQGLQVAKLAKNRTLAFKGLLLTGLDFAVCDVCVPPEVQLALGQSVTQRLTVAHDASTQELVLTPLVDVSRGSSLALVQEKRATYPAAVNDFSLSANGEVLGVAFSEEKGQRTREVYEREKHGMVEPVGEWNVAAFVDAHTLEVKGRFRDHHGVVSTVAISPDGKSLVSGGWDKTLVLHGKAQVEKFGWSLRRARFSRDGRWLVVAAWTPQNALGNHQSDPSAVVYEVLWAADATVVK